MKSVIICDMEGVIQEMNKGALEMFGYTKKELIGKKRVSIFSPGEIVIQNVLGWLEVANKKGKSLVKTNFIKKDGSKFNAEILITSLLPKIIKILVTYGSYRLECAVRGATLLGVFGMGGIGSDLQLSLQSLQFKEAWTSLWMLGIVMITLERYMN